MSEKTHGRLNALRDAIEEEVGVSASQQGAGRDGAGTSSEPPNLWRNGPGWADWTNWVQWPKTT